MTTAAAFGSTSTFGYGNNGLLVSRSNAWRTVTINQRDGLGRLLQQSATVGATNALVENLSWRADSTINTYAATRSGSGAWNDSRGFQYNTRNQLVSEPVGLTTGSLATNTYGFDVNKLGVLTSIQLSGGLPNNWLATGLNPFAQITSEAWNLNGLSLRAGGSAANASSVSALLDGSSLSGLSLGGGRWYADLNLSVGSHTLAATANYNVGQYSASATSAFSVSGTNSVTNYYDDAGNVTSRVFGNGKTQTLVWDAAGRLVSLTERNNPTNGFNWTAIYDALGRRLETTQVPIVNGVTNSIMTLTLDSYYDPEVEFREVGVGINGQKTWMLVGPGVNGRFGSLQGVGGLEATILESSLQVTPVLNDYFGNVLASVAGGATSWNPVRVTGYGPEIGYETPTLTPGTPLVDTLVWRSRKADPSGLYWLGARYYDPLAGRFLSSDPSGHSASWDLYNFASGDPINRFDADGRCDRATDQWATDIGTGVRSLLNNALGTVGYLGLYGLNQDAAERYYGQQARGMFNTIAGTTQIAYDASSFAVFAALTAWLPDETAQAYGPSIDWLSGVLNQMTGGEGNSTAYRTTYTLLNAATFMLGGEVGEAGRFGRLGEMSEPILTSEEPLGTLTANAGKETGIVAGGPCFVAGTLIATAKGLKPIEDVRAGDFVWSYDEENGQTALNKVSRAFVRPANATVEIQTGDSLVSATPEHPFWVENVGWTAARNLKAGDLLLTLDGHDESVSGVQRRTGTIVVYNFEVADAHSYFVSSASILVHNACSPFNQTVNLGQENIFYREPQLSAQTINDYRPFDQALSDAEQPIQAVRTPEGLHIMQGNNRVYGAVLDDRTIQMNVYTPAEWEAVTGQSFNPNPAWSTSKPVIVPGRRSKGR